MVRKGIIILLFAACILGFTDANHECPDLVAGPHMVLSETVGWVGDQPVSVTCEDGYVLDTMFAEKTLSCIAGQDSAIWSETLGSCQKKQCPDLLSTFGSNIVVSNQTSMLYHYGDNVTMECKEGYAFDVDLNEPVDRVTTQKVFFCEDDINSSSAKWSSGEECQMISCDIPPTVEGSVMVYTSTAFNSTVMYQCKSGLIFGAERFVLTATCNASALWSTNLGTDLDTASCAKTRRYMGCLQNGSMVPLTTTEDINNDLAFCIDVCKTKGNRFAAVHGSTCSCGNVLVEEYVEVDNSNCGLLCPGYDVTDTSRQVFCGGPSGETAVYVTLDGCYQSVNFTTESTEFVSEDAEITCRERCRGRDFSHAALQNDSVCYCLNTSAISADPTDSVKCRNMSLYNTTNIFDLARVNNLRQSCNELFINGVRMNGEYYLQGNNSTVTCYFKDGTICADGWIGYNGYCYHFNNKTKMGFQNARNYCLSLDADLVSIASSEEQSFLEETRSIYKDLWADIDESKWWLGLVDVHSTALYMWLDGSIGTYSYFKWTPKDLTKHLAVDDSAVSYKWFESDDSVAYNVMCKKPREGPHCVTTASPTADYTISHNTMSVTYCIQVCKGQDIQYAMIQNSTCNCVHTLPTFTAVDKISCDTICPGNNFQHCGGDSNTFSVLNVHEKMAARSCEELQLVGIDNNTFLLQADKTTANFEHCDQTECPFSWINLNGHCYKYMLYSSKIQDAITTCASEDAYMVSIETEKEIEDVITAASNISLYSSTEAWKVGLMALSLNGGLYRWSNGKLAELQYWNNSATGLTGTIVRVWAPAYGNWQARKAGSDLTMFICEKGGDYLGCFSAAGMSWDVTIQEYYSMTIQQCVEFCRASNRKYAYLNSTSCTCETGLTAKLRGLCSSVCSGQDNQMCGGTNVMSVYDVDEYPQFANNCTDLFLAGIFLSGTYLVAGSEQICNFTDGTVCTGDGWIGIDGICYKHFPKGQESRDETCRTNGAVQTSLTTFADYVTLLQYVRRINFHGNTFRVFTGITHGGYNLDVFISEDGFLTDYELLNNGHLSALDLHDSFGYISFRFDHGHKQNYDGGVICKESKYLIGCFEVPDGVDVILKNFGSLELTLCRQICVTYAKNVTLIGRDFCACASESALTSFVSTSGASCDVRCKIHKDQLCGNGSSVWAYHSGIDDLPYAENCFHLYKSGVFYNTTYRLKSSDPSVPFNESQCGFADETICPATWLGNEGVCYRFVTDHLTFSDAFKHCAGQDAYLFNPVEEKVTNFVRNFINTSGLFSDTVLWTGITPVFYNTSFVASNGMLVAINNSTEESRPVIYTVFNSNTLAWKASSDDQEKLSFVCQSDKDFLGCHSIVSTPDAHYKDLTGNSVTQCIFWCKGQDHNYAAAFSGDCICFHDYPLMTSAYGKCNIVCEGGKSQMCGGISPEETVYYSVYNITDIEGVNGSCQDLFKQGISKPGQYKMRHNALAPYIKMSCFQNPEPLDYVRADMKTLSASSVLDGHIIEHLGLIFPFTSAWKPMKDETNEFIKIILTHEYLITGIVISGLHTHSEQSYLTSYTLKYRDLILGSLETYYTNGSAEVSSGCQESNMLCFHILTNPLITNELHLFPSRWHNSVSVQLVLAGQPYTQFDHSKTYIGCAADPDFTFTNEAVVSNVDECILLCHERLQPFASVDYGGNCFCGKGDFDYGFVEDSFCPLHTSGLYHTGLGFYRALHRTFFKVTHYGKYEMERVTLGIVGDPFVGKTLLCVSYTANYVYKDYKPTVLNHHWTNVIVDSHVVDLIIWDLPGSDEYSELRPLCYPQVDAFLVCFSLKSPDSFESVQTKWIPEIEEHAGKIPVILVGCKRDDCLKSSSDSIDTISTEEGEEMARVIRARRYVETSAIEQSGFTSVFHTAILAGLERKKTATW